MVSFATLESVKRILAFDEPKHLKATERAASKDREQKGPEAAL
jgi:hypothetical protein